MTQPHPFGPSAADTSAPRRTAPSGPVAGSPARSAPATTSPNAPRHRRVATALGEYVFAAEGEGITGLWRARQSHYPRPERLGRPASPDDLLLTRAEEQLLAYLGGERENFALPLAPRGTPFQHAVWDRLREIPRGSTTTYGRIAHDLGRPRAAQAVGAAVGSNPISIVVPCHRVLGTSGAITGYAGGTETKQALLVLEGALPA
ncbi:methylated-DNA--[protein]-cysteine S-methyltransferase [Brachybacterium sp. GCM10030268]|uniref:methylated-DNA--[protein]-cysteine S-methyltransferase n=1 Tax=Brachybacterium sp. GCM10030268 TaxID=3273382 RepID=UPI0036244752